MNKIDITDYKILQLLKENSQQPLKALAEKLNSKSSTIHARIKKLETNGVIKRYSINLDNKKIGLPLVGFIMLVFEKSETNLDQETIAKKIAKLSRVQEVHLIAGEYDIFVKVRAKNIEDLGEFVTRDLKKIEGVGPSRTFVSLKIVKESSDTPFAITGIIDDYSKNEKN